MPSPVTAEKGKTSSLPKDSLIRRRERVRWLLATLSIFVATNWNGTPKWESHSIMFRSSFVGSCLESRITTTSRKRSSPTRNSSIIEPQRSLMRCGTFANPYPGKSTKTQLPSTSKKLMIWVRPGVELVLARFFRPTRLLIKLDLPTFDLPTNAIWGSSISGYSLL